MDITFLGPWPLFLMAIFIFIIVIASSSHRRPEPHTRDRSCPRCGGVYPPFANYCARCGHELE
jgi:predicted amidophosphoribosyltransferase